MIKMCLCHICKTRSVIVPWTHIQPCPGHIYNRVLDTYNCALDTYNCALDTFYKHVFGTFKYVFTPFIYGKKTKILTHFKLLPNFQIIVHRKCEDFGNYICSGN